MQVDLIQIVPTEEDGKQNKRVKGSEFSGYVLRFNQTGEQLLMSYRYEKGKVTGVFKPEALSKQGRQSSSNKFYILYPSGEVPPGAHETVLINGEMFVAYEITGPYDGFRFGSGVFSNFDGGGLSSGGLSGFWISGDTTYYPNTNIYDQGVAISGNEAAIFIENIRSLYNIEFTEGEKELIREHPKLITSLSAYIYEHGQKPDGSNAFKLSADIQRNYPRFTDLVKSLPSFVEQSPRVKQALISQSKLSWSKIKLLLQFGSGPQIYVFDMDAGLRGQTINPGFPEKRINIDARLVRGLETANLVSTREVTAFMLTFIILHETVHYGAADANVDETVYEFGDEFEKEVLGTKINVDNAGRLYIEFRKRN